MGAWVWVGSYITGPLCSPAVFPRYHKVGILVLFLHDISDVQLEFTKLNVYFKSRGGAHHRLHALAADLGCLSFCLSW